jgi:uncharacterized repeat protein (TIGR01451 family)
MNLNKNMNSGITKAALFVLIGATVLLLSGVASATPSQNAIPPIIKQGQVTNLIIAAPNVAETGTQISIWNPLASPTFGVTCPLPGPSGGTEWIVQANSSGTFSNVSYQIPIGGSINITGFGDQTLLTIQLSGGATISPTGAGITYAFVDAVTGTPQTDNTTVAGNYPFSSCGTDTATGLGYVGTALFQVIQPNTTLTINGPAKVENGTTVTFTYNETNTGSSNAPLTNVSVIDANCPTSPLTFSGTLSPGQTATLTCDVKLSTASGSVTETAIGNATDALGDFITYPAFPGERNSTTVTVIHPAITLSKNVSATKIENNTQVTYTYNVTNTGDTALTVNISDDKLGVILAPTVIAAGASNVITKTATLTTTTTNTATATGVDQTGAKVTATASKTVTVIQPAISLTKNVSATKIENNTQVTYTYNVTNTGNTALTVNISDDKLGVILAPTVIAAGASNVITKTATLTTTTTNTATATGVDQTGAKVTATASKTVTVITPAISLTKNVSATKIENNTQVTYTYNATNTGNTALTVNISDDKLGVILAPTVIAAGASTGDITKTATLTTTTTNTATATGVDQTGAKVTATASKTVTVIHPAISLTKTPSSTEVPSGSTVTYTYNVTNTGDVILKNVDITDNTAVTPNPVTSGQTLNVSEMKTFTATAVITANTTNIATTNGTDQTGAKVTAQATATVTVPPTGNQGCTPGFWKENALKHTASQWPAPYTPNETLADAGFKNATVVNLSTTTLLDALQFQGGSGVGGAEQILLRSAVSALLNSASTGVNYPLTTSQVLSEVNAALATHNRTTILALASQLDQDNNLGCPLSQNT